MEAQRVLRRLGFVCRRAKDLTYSGAAWVAVDAGADHPPSVEDRLAALNGNGWHLAGRGRRTTRPSKLAGCWIGESALSRLLAWEAIPTTWSNA